MLPDSLKNLIESFKYLPGIGEKTAERLSFAVLELDDDQVEFFSESLNYIKKSIKNCSKCNILTDKNVCSICVSDRDSSLLFVVEDSKTVFLFEKLGLFNGCYHVLNGLINPLDGVNPEDVGLDKLIDRINLSDFKEIVFAFKPSIEGETTSLYIKKILDGMDINITRIASGIPLGADIEYIDKLTLERALTDRKEV